MIVDLFLVYQFIRRLSTPFKEWDAYKLGIIDETGKQLIKRKDFTKRNQKDAFGIFDIMITKLKRLLEKVPGGKTRIGSYAAALYSIKEQSEIEKQDIHLIEDLSESSLEEKLNQYIEYVQNSNEDIDQLFERAFDEDVPGNSVANVAGLGVGDQGEPGITPKAARKYKRKNQEKAFESWQHNENLVLAGSAGTGKTFIAMYLALQSTLEPATPYHKTVVIRSIVPTRDVGYLPGSLQEKAEPFEEPYKQISLELFDYDSAVYNKLINNHQMEFLTTSFIRGLTIDNSIIIVDEMQNLNFHELDSVITRVGENTRIIFSGDYHQSDFKDGHERDGIQKFLRIVEQLKNFEVVTFNWQDIVRSGFLRDYIMTKEMLGYK